MVVEYLRIAYIQLSAYKWKLFTISFCFPFIALYRWTERKHQLSSWISAGDKGGWMLQESQGCIGEECWRDPYWFTITVFAICLPPYICLIRRVKTVQPLTALMLFASSLGVTTQLLHMFGSVLLTHILHIWQMLNHLRKNSYISVVNLSQVLIYLFLFI